MATALNSAYSSGYKPSGADLYRHFRAWSEYTVSYPNSTNVRIAIWGGAQLDHSMTSKTYTATVHAGSYSNGGSCTFTYKSSGAVNKKQTGSVTHDFPRGTSDYTVNVGVSCSYSGTTKAFVNSSPRTASVNITIPALDKYAVSFVMNGHGVQVSSQSIFYGYKAIEPTIPVDNHYGFLGWYTDVACTIPYNFNNAVTSNIVLYAKWIKLYPTTRVKVNGVWYRGEFRCKMNNQICDVVDGFTKVNGVWVPINRS